MQVYKTYFKVMKKQFLAILLYGLMFLGITLIITFSIFRENSKKFEIKKIPVHVVNQDESSPLTEGMLTYLKQYVEFINVKDEEEARRDALFNRQVSYILTIPDHFTEDLLKGHEVLLTKQTIPGSADSVSVDTAINNYLNTARLYIKYQEGATVEELNEYISHNLKQETKVSFDLKRKDDAMAANEFNRYYFNYLGYIMIICFIIGISTVMMAFHGIDLRRRHFASPISSRNYNIQLIMANLVFILCYIILFIVAGYVCNPYRSLDLNLLFMWLNAILFGFTALSISYLIGICVKGKNAVQALSTMLSLSMAFISGMFVPQEFLGSKVLRVASFTPTYWYVKANNALAQVSGFSLKNMSDILGAMVIQVGFTIAIISIALVVSKRKRQQAY